MKIKKVNGRICTQILDGLIPVQGTRTTIFYFTLFHSQFDPTPPPPPPPKKKQQQQADYPLKVYYLAIIWVFP